MMKKALNTVVASLAVATLMITKSHAGLIDRGNGMLYDTVLDVTWLQDANYAKTSSYDSDGLMNWDEAMSWADGLIYEGYSDWRLAGVDTNDDTCGARNYDYFYGPGCSGTDNELAFMFSENLGLHGILDANYVRDPNWHNTAWGTQIANSFVDATTGETMHIENLLSAEYWSSVEYERNSEIHSWKFNYGGGSQNTSRKDESLYAWAVRDGDVSFSTEISEPNILALLGIGLIVFGGRKHLTLKRISLGQL